MKDVFIFLAIITPLICVSSYLIVLLERRNKQVKSLAIENQILKHDASSRIVDTYRIRFRQENLLTTIDSGGNKGIKITFEDTSGKFGHEMLDEYELTPKELLDILQKHDDKNNFQGYCSKETVKGKRCKEICNKPECGW